MKLRRIMHLLLALALLFSAVPRASAYTPGDAYQIDLKAFIHDVDKREYVERMLEHYIRTDRDIQNALDGGFSAVFLFDGCSDNLNDPELSDLTYYRVSGVCLVIKKSTSGQLKLIYFNGDASTIPDRPLKYGAWNLPRVGDVGPATVVDGTYQVYSVRHKGEYEALHLQTDFRDDTVDAVYLTTDGGFTVHRASEINIHTRTSNHIANYGMWSAGCFLVGDGNRWEYDRLLSSAYYTIYDTYESGNFVGTVTVDRKMLWQELYDLYENPDAVEMFLGNAHSVLPSRYISWCMEETLLDEPEVRVASTQMYLMSLPCTQEENACSRIIKTIPKGEKVTVTGSVRNVNQTKWYYASYDGEEGYLFAGDAKRESWWARFGT